jgi:hypothetical protein
VARISVKELDKSVRLLDGYLCKLSMAVKPVEDVTFRNFLGGKIAYFLGD